MSSKSRQKSLIIDSAKSHKENENPYRHRPSPSKQRSRSSPSTPRNEARDSQNQRHHHRHSKRSTIPAPDTIDRLGAIIDGVPYHHDGPYEATLLARQVPGHSPVEAVKESNAAAIAATPRANIVDCLEKHYPLQGTAVIPPGVGGMGYYEEYDVMIRDGDYKRWKHMEYRDEDRKGKGEPSYTIEEFEKQQKATRRHRLDGYEMMNPSTRRRHRSVSLGSGGGGGSRSGSATPTSRMEEGFSRLRQRLRSLKDH